MEEEYEVPSPHEEALEEAGKRQRDAVTQKIAVITAIRATVGALISYQSGAAQTEAMFLKNQSILKQAEASDQWAYYQPRLILRQQRRRWRNRTKFGIGSLPKRRRRSWASATPGRGCTAADGVAPTG